MVCVLYVTSASEYVRLNVQLYSSMVKLSAVMYGNGKKFSIVKLPANILTFTVINSVHIISTLIKSKNFPLF